MVIPLPSSQTLITSMWLCLPEILLPKWDFHHRVYPKEINFKLQFICFAALFTVGCRRWAAGAQGITNLEN